MVETKENLSYYFNAGGQLVYVSEPNGNFLVFDHDVNSGLVSRITTARNLSIDFTYNDRPGTDPTTVKEVTLPDGSSMSYGYSAGKLTQATKKGAGGAGGITYAYSYDANGNLSSIKDAAGNTYSLSCGKDGTLTEAVYPDGQSISLAIDKAASSSVTTVKKDGFVMAEETAVFEKSSGNCLRTEDEKEVVTTYEYRDNMLAKTTSQTAYETLENGVVTEQQAVSVTTTEYDESQNVTAEESGFEQWSETVEYTYNFDGVYDDDLPSSETVTDADGDLISDIDYDYDDYGNLIYEFDDVTDILTEYDYYTEDDEVDVDLLGELASETESLNGVVQSKTTYTYSYDSAGNKTETATEVCGDVTTVTVSHFDNMGRELDSQTSVNGSLKSSQTNQFDLYGRVIKSITTEGSLTTTVTTSYTANGAVDTETTVTADGGKTSTTQTTYTYDSMNRVTAQTVTADGKSRPETTTYNYASMNEKGVFGGETVYAKITAVTSGSTTTKSYEDPRGNVFREDANGVSTYYTYDLSGNQIGKVTLGDGETLSDAVITACTYDQMGNQTHTLTDVSYDSESGTFSCGEDTIVTTSVYDSQSREIKSVDGKGTETAMSYDAEGRMTAVTQDAAGSKITTTVSYTDPTAADNTTSAVITMAGGTKSKTVTNVQGLTVLESTIGGSSSIDSSFQYTDAGNVLKQTDSAGNYRTYEYDSADRQTAVNYFDKNSSQSLRSEFVYDANGNVTVMKDYTYENGSKVLYRYTEKRYDGFGRLISEAEVDTEGSVPSETDLAARRITYTYDSDDRLTQAVYPSGFDSSVSGLSYEYGAYSRIAKINAVTDSGEETLRAYTYDSRGRVAEIKDYRTALGGTGYTLKTYSYDRLDRPAGITVTDSEKDGTAEAYTYAYDENSQIVKETKLNLYPAEGTGRLDETWDYTYDRLGRLTTTTVIDDASGAVKTQKAYTYDSAGNRLTETENGQTVTNTYNLLNQMVTSGGSTYTYDANGNQTKESSAGAVKEYIYDADNRLDTVTVTENGETALQQKNLYNGEGQRIRKTENGQTTSYAYQGGSVVYTDGSEGKQSLNIMGDAGNVIACERDATGGKAYYYYNKDMRASTTSILDGSGNCQAAYEYSDFGETTVNSDFYNEIAYTGGIWDQSTGLYYLNARYYDPDDGRFLTEDTYRGSENDPNSLHLYAYCYNDPVNLVDTSGNIWETVLDVASIGWSAYELAHNPSWKAVGYLVWDVGATFLPFVPGSYVAKGSKAAKIVKKLTLKVPSTLSEVKKGKYLTVGTYNALKKTFKGAKNRKQIEIHHIIEKRFSDNFNFSSNKWACVALDKDVHRVITNRFRNAWPYGGRKRLTEKEMRKVINEVYCDMPQLKELALKQVNKHYKKKSSRRKR